MIRRNYVGHNALMLGTRDALRAVMKSESLRRPGSTLKVVAVCAVAILASACGSEASDGRSSESAVFPSNATEMVILNDGGGLVGAPPSGSQCQSGEAIYTLTVTTRHFAWEECQTSAGGPYTRTNGARDLSQAEADGLLASVRSVTVSSSTSCGADKSALLLSVTTPDGEHHYLDDFYACNRAGTYVTGLDALLAAAAKLVK